MKKLIFKGAGVAIVTPFTENGVTVYSEVQTPNVGDVAKLFAEGKVDRMSPDAACNHR